MKLVKFGFNFFWVINFIIWVLYKIVGCSMIIFLITEDFGVG